MNIIKSTLIICLAGLLVSGCLKSETKLSTASNTAYPLAPGAVYDLYELANGEWTHDDVITIYRESNGPGYYYTNADPEDNGIYSFTLIQLGGGRYAAENATESAFEYAFLEFNNEGVYKWDVGGNSIMRAIEADLAFQQQLGTRCLDGECTINSVSDLRKIMNYILENDFQPYRFYRQRS